MTESAFTSKLLKALRSHVMLRDAVIWKLNDRTTSGIPDFVVTTREGRTTWWEVKVAPNDLTKIQRYYLAKLRFSWSVVLLKGDLVSIRPQGIPVNSYCNFKMAIEAIAGRCCLAVDSI